MEERAGRKGHVKEEEADLLSLPGIFLTSNWPWSVKIGKREAGKREEMDIPQPCHSSCYLRPGTRVSSLVILHHWLSSPFPPLSRPQGSPHPNSQHALLEPR